MTTIKAAQQLMVKNIVAQQNAMPLETVAQQHVINEMTNIIKTSSALCFCFFGLVANAQNTQLCNLQQAELKMYSRSELLNYICESKESIQNAELSLVKMQIGLSAKKESNILKDNYNFIQLKDLADSKEFCVASVTIAFSELSKYGVKGGSVYDAINYCEK